MGGERFVREWLVSLLMVLGCVRCVCAQPGMIGTDAGRVDVTTGPVAELAGGPAWVFPASDPGVTQELGWVGASRVAIDAQRVYAMSIQRGGEPARLIAVDRVSGLLAWWVELPDAVFDSWSSPTLDRTNGMVLITTGQPGSLDGVVQAFDSVNGVLEWEVQLNRDVVNASVVVSDDLGVANRAFIVDYEGFYQGGTGAAVTCINVDAFDATNNPHEPGDVVWSVDLFDGASGATPAYADGRLYVGTTGDTFAGTGGGRVVCLDAGAASGVSAVVWDTAIGGDDGFFGPMSVKDDAVFGVTYDFFGGDRSSRLVKLDAASGAIEWIAASDRSSVAPVPLEDGRVLVSAGIVGFGSVPRLTLYADHGTSGVELWDTVLSTWADNGNGQIEPGEYLAAGGWSFAPTVRIDRGRTLAVVGRDGGSGGGGLVMVDLGLMPDEAGFVVDSFAGVTGGGSPAAGFVTVYAVGDDGISVFGVPIWADVDGDGIADVDDLRAWQRGIGLRDVNLDGVVNASDAAALEGFVRRNEWWDMIAGRRP